MTGMMKGSRIATNITQKAGFLYGTQEKTGFEWLYKYLNTILDFSTCEELQTEKRFNDKTANRLDQKWIYLSFWEEKWLISGCPTDNV